MTKQPAPLSLTTAAQPKSEAETGQVPQSITSVPLLQATEDGYFQLVMPKTPEKNEHAGKVYGDLQMLQEQLGIPALNVDSKEQE